MVCWRSSAVGVGSNKLAVYNLLVFIRILGSHNIETGMYRHTCFLVDDKLVVDAGSLMTTLNQDERDRIQAILITHRHFDHVRDLPSLGLSTIETTVSVSVYALPDTLDVIGSHLMDGVMYPDFTITPTANHPKFIFEPLTEGRIATVLGFQVKAIPVPHSPGAVGYILSASQEEVVAFTGDTGGGLGKFFRDPLEPRLIFVDLTFSNRESDKARKTGHLTPNLLREQLIQAIEQDLRLPEIVAVHMDVSQEEQIKEEIKLIEKELSIQILVASEGAEFSIG